MTACINYTSNFNPVLYKFYKNLKNKNKKKINCRNLFLFLFLLKYSNNFFKTSSISVFIKPKQKLFFNILKAPYKNKLFKTQIGLTRYFIIFKFIFLLKKLLFKNYNQFFEIFKKFVYFFSFFETNITQLHKIYFFYNFKIKHFFYL